MYRTFPADLPGGNDPRMDHLRAAVASGTAGPLQRVLLAEALANGVREALGEGRDGRAFNLLEELRELAFGADSGEPVRLELAAALLALHAKAVRDGQLRRATECLNDLRALGRRGQATEEQRLALVTALAREHWEAARFRQRERAGLLLQQLRVLALRPEAPEAQRDHLARALARECQVESGLLGDAEAVRSALAGLRALCARERATPAQRAALREGLAAALTAAHAAGGREVAALEREVQALQHAGDSEAADALLRARLAGARSAQTSTRPRAVLALAQEALTRAEAQATPARIAALADALVVLPSGTPEDALLASVARFVDAGLPALPTATQAEALLLLLGALRPVSRGARGDLARVLVRRLVEGAEAGWGVEAGLEAAHDVLDAARAGAVELELLERLLAAAEGASLSARAAQLRAGTLVGLLERARQREAEAIGRPQLGRLWRLIAREGAGEEERSTLALGLQREHAARLAAGDSAGADKLVAALSALAGRPQAESGQARALVGALASALAAQPAGPARLEAAAKHRAAQERLSTLLEAEGA